MGAATTPAEPSAKPTIAQRNSEDRPGLEQRRYVITAVPQSPLVTGPARAEDVVRNGLAVQISLEYAMCSGVQGGPGDRPMTFLQHEFGTKQRCSIEIFVRGYGQCRPCERHEFLSISRCLRASAACCAEE